MDHKLCVGSAKDFFLLFILHRQLVKVNEESQNRSEIVRIVFLQVTIEDRFEELKVVQNLGKEIQNRASLVRKLLTHTQDDGEIRLMIGTCGVVRI